MSVLGWLAFGLAALLGAGALFTLGFERWAGRRFAPKGRFVPIPGGRLHVLDLQAEEGAPVVLLLHGASGNAQDMMAAIGQRLAGRYRVLAVDRPGHGWSDRPGGRADASPARQAALIRAGLDALGVGRVLVVGHSWSGALATRFALDHPDTVAGLLLLAPVTHPWPGGVTWYYGPASHPALGGLFTRTIAAPVGAAWLKPAVAGVFHPNPAPADYVARGATWLVLRPAEFRANAEDVQHLLGHVKAQFPRYGEIAMPTTIIHGEADTTVSPVIHAQAIARQVPEARLILLPGVGHMPHYTHPELIVDELDALARRAGLEPVS